jgi:arylsulfatase A-like enzyme
LNRRKFLHFTSAALATGGHTVPGLADQTGAQVAKDKRRFLDEKTATNAFHLRDDRVDRPNIFLVTLDMVSPDFYHPSRPLSQALDLPTLRSLIRDGVFFSNAFATAPLCAPSRSSYLTGRYSYVLGNGERAPDGLETELRSNDVIFPEYLKASGYITKQCGKGHVGTKKFIDAFGENDNSWNRWSPPIYDDEIYLEYQRRLGVKPQRYSREVVLLLRDRKTPGNSVGGWIEQSDGKPFPLEAHYSYYLAQRAVNKLQDAWTNPTRQRRPIYLQLDIFDPHQPLSVPDGLQNREKALRPVLIPPESYEKVRVRNWRPLTEQPKIYDLYREYWGLYDPRSLLDYRVAYALQMEVVDQALSLFVKELKQQGLYDEAVIIVASDHGEMNGRWGVIDKGAYLFPDVVRVPLVMKMPASMRIQPRTIDSPVSLLDVAPTLLDVAGIDPEARLDGQSLLPILRDVARSRDRELMFSCGWHVGVNFACGIQKWDQNGAHYLYAYNVSSRIDELYDLNSVDAENLAQAPEHATLRKQMIDRLGAALQSDPRWQGYWASFRVDNFFDLPNSRGDMQLVEPR